MISSDTLIDELLKQQSREDKKYSFTMLSNQLLTLLLRKGDFGEQKFQNLIINGSSEIKKHIALNSNINFSQWIQLKNDIDSEVCEAALENKKFLSLHSSVLEDGNKNVS